MNRKEIILVFLLFISLYSEILEYVTEESLNWQTPQFGTLHPDEGGYFIFY